MSSETNIKEFFENEKRKGLLRFSTAGSVDDGKSTLIGRLLHDSKSIYEDLLASLKAYAGSSEIDLAHLTDGLKAEREQGITIDVAYRYFSTPKRKFIIADTPGHEQYTRNMATGASTADLAIVLIDARNGVITQSKRHSFISSLLGIPHMVVAVNKMDLVDYSEDRFEEIKKDFTDFSARLGIRDLHYIPVSALKGDNVVGKGDNMPWYKGAPLLEYLENVHVASDRNLIDLRFPVQYVLRPDLTFRGYCGQISSGVIRRGDKVKILPSEKESRVKTIVSFDGELEYAFAPQSVTIVLEDERDISRGDMIVHPHNIPHINRHFEGMLVWMSPEPLGAGREYLIKHTTRYVRTKIDEIRYKVDVNTLHRIPSEQLELNEIGRVVFTCRQPIYHDSYAKNRSTGNFIIVDLITNSTVGAGMILDREPSDKLPVNIITEPSQKSKRAKFASSITDEEREKKYAQKPATIWFTGLVSSGKREIAQILEKKIFDNGGICVVLDGSRMRAGVSSGLDFSNIDTAEHLRRAAETCKILNDSGLIVICSFVSPSKSVRAQIAEIIGEERYNEIFVDPSPEWCASRDETGLYQKAKEGEVNYLAGVSFPYEKPESAKLAVNPEESSFEDCATKIYNSISHYLRV